MGDSGRRFSEAEVDAILKRAVARQEHGQSLSRDELADVLRQLNLDESVLDEAIEEQDAERAVADETAAWMERRRRAVLGHAATFASVMTLLVAINLLVTPHFLWFFWPLFGWGLGLLADWRRYQRGPEPGELASFQRQQAERAARAERKAEKATRKARKREADEAMARASEDLKDAVKVGVAGLLDSVGKALREAADGDERAAPRARREPRSGVRVDVAAAGARRGRRGGPRGAARARRAQGRPPRVTC
ncbi:MAG: 2TM domain-containing protein [Deltaproteobacteria bacterium]|nr:2TM domain-containing protein [Deltaproteobacteria bacterium]